MTATEILLNKYGILTRAGRKIECPFCHHNTMSIKSDDTLAKCFHPACGRYITPYQHNLFYENSFYQVLEAIYHNLHQELLKPNPSLGGAYKYLVEERKIHTKVISDSMLGIVPRNYNIDQKFEAAIAEIKEQIAKGKEERKGKRGRPKKENFTPEDKLVLIDVIKEKWNKAARPGWLAFFYLDRHYRIVTIRFRKPYSKEMYSFKPFEKKGMGLFGHQLFTPIRLPSSIKQKDDYTAQLEARYEELNSRLIVTEGEFNSLQLQSLMVRVAEHKGIEPSYVFTCSVGGAGCADYECIKNIARQPIFAYDNDPAGRAMVKKAQDFMNLTAFTIPDSVLSEDNDLDDFIKRFADGPMTAFANIQALVKDRKPYPRTYQSVAEEIFRTRQVRNEEDKRRQFEVHLDVAEIIRKDLLERGKFYHDDQSAYLFFDLEKKLFAIHKDDNQFQNLLAKYGLMSSEIIYRYVIDYLQAEAFQNGTLTEIHRFAFFNKENFTLYLFNHCNQIYRISADAIELKDNGVDQVLFLSDQAAEPFEIALSFSDDPQEKNVAPQLLNDELIDKINFNEDMLAIEERRLLFRYYFLSLFFESLLPTKIIVCFVGEKGSGKSVTLRKLGMLLFGSKFDVKSLPNNEDDFDTIAVNSYLFFIDNADTKCSWLNDRLARIATGAVISKRELYTTAKMYSKAAKCFLGITSRTPHFRRDDVADRLLLMPVKRFDRMIPESILLSSIRENRNAMMKETVILLQKAVRALKKWKDTQETGNIRMADFYAFAIKIAREEGKEEKLENIFAKMSKEQSLFTLDYDVIFELLSDWVNLKCDDGFGTMIPNSEREITSNVLNNELAILAEKKEIGYPYKDKSRAFAQRLSNVLANLREFFIVTVREGRGRIKLYSFAWRQENVNNRQENDELPF